MGFVNKLGNKAQEVRGRIKRNAGATTDDRKREAEGGTDEVKGNLKQAGEKFKDAFRRRRGHRRRPM